MIKSIQCDISLSIIYLNKPTPNDINTGFGNNNIPNGGNTVVIIAVHYDILLYINIEVYGDK